MKRRLYERGFTLVEVMLAVAIAAVALCGILATYAACFTLIRTSKNASIATSAAQGLLDEIRNTSFPLIKSTYNGTNFTVNNMPLNRGIVYVDDSNPELLKVTISVCWKQGNIVVGEDKNLNGSLDTGEDANSNGIIDSPVELTTLIVNR